MPSTSLDISDYLNDGSWRHYAVTPAGQWWRVVSKEGEVARYRTRTAALEGAYEMAEAMRRLGVESEVLTDLPYEPTPRAA